MTDHIDALPLPGEERMRFFRDLIQSQREEVFRVCGISEAMLGEAKGIHSHERRLLNYLERQGLSQSVRERLGGAK